MPTVAIVFHSNFGHTKAIAHCIAEGAESAPGTTAHLIATSELPTPEDGAFAGDWAALSQADAIVFGCPTYMGSMTAELKRVFEDAGSIWASQGWKNKLAAGFTNAGATSGDKLSTLQGINHFCMQQSMIWISQGIMYTGPNEEDINRMGSWLGMMAQSTDDDPEVTPPAGDRKTAELFGVRIAEITAQFCTGEWP